MEHLHDRMDKLFAEGALWNHRTLRTIFDPYGEEWRETNMNRKIEILKNIIDNGESLDKVFEEFKQYYSEDLANKEYVSDNAYKSLIIFLELLLKDK